MKEKIVVTLCALLLFLLPFILWGDLKIVGGDDSQLYYFFPNEYFSRFTTNIVADNSLGGIGVYYPQIYLSLFALFLFATKSLFYFLNPQYLLYGLNLACGFAFFYLLLSLFIKTKDWGLLLIKSLASFCYVFSIFSAYSVWSHHLLSLYLVALFPLILFIFIKSVYEKRYILVIVDALIISFFSAVIFTPPYLIALLISTSPFFAWTYLHNKKIFIKYTVLLFVVLVLLNLYWMLPFLHTLLAPQISYGIANKVSSQESLDTGKHVIEAVAGQNQILFPLLNLFHKNIQINFNWGTYEVFSAWYVKFIFLGISFLITIAYAGFISLKKRVHNNILYFVALFGWLIALFFYTVNIGEWGMSLFVFLNDYVPGFVMYRNMYDKFSLAIAFSYSLVLGISFYIVYQTVKKKYKIYANAALIVLLLFFLLASKPFINDELYTNPLWTTKSTFTRINDFNEDFYSLAKKINILNTNDRFIWLPINRASYAVIQDSILKNHYYIGVSPLRLLTGKSDITGSLSFPNFLPKNFTEAVLDRDTDTVNSYLQKMNVGYVIINKSINKELQTSYIYSSIKDGDLFYAQDQSFIQNFLGKKIGEFGNRYSLYEVKSDIKSRKIYLTENINIAKDTNATISYKKLASYKYRIKIKNLKNDQYLVFLEPFHRGWELFLQENRLIPIENHHKVFNYANAWKISTKDLNLANSKEVDLLLFFKPQLYFFYALIVSATSWIIIISYLIYYLIFKERKRNV